MLSGGFYDDDPFFAAHREQMRQMNQMFRDPFGIPSSGMLGIAAPPQATMALQQQQLLQQQQQQQILQQQQQQQLAVASPMDLFGFGGFGGMFQNMRRMMTDMHSTLDAPNPNGQMFSQSSFVSYSSNAGGQPKVYQASSSTTQGPGGVRETRKTVRDSQSGVEKMSVGHHIGSRGHVMERQRNRHTGDQEENQEFINLEEEEAPEFDREWVEQTRQIYGPGRLDYRRRQDRANRRHQALPAPGQRPSHHNQRTPSYRDRE